MTIAEFEKNNIERTMPKEWIGQGWGYKAEWNPDRPTDIIYIPEYGYEDTDLEEGEELEGDLVPRENAFSVEDFIRICDGDEKKAERVFDSADWQFPYSILDEPWFECEEESEDIETMNTEKAACDFKDWLVDHGYLEFEEGLEDEQAIVEDFAKAYEVAPRLINLLGNIADK